MGPRRARREGAGPVRELALLLLLASGCGGVPASLGFVGAGGSIVNTKLLVPGAYARSCRVSLLGVPLGDEQRPLDDAIRQLLARDSEGNVITDLQVGWSGIMTGVYNQECVEVRGDVGRLISTVLLPGMTPPDHHAP